VGYVCDGGVVRMQFPLGYSGGKILGCPLESLTALGRASRAARNSYIFYNLTHPVFYRA